MSAELIERLEKATGPDVGLFDEAWVACFGRDSGGARWERYLALINVGAWTDAALMLVPECLPWMVRYSQPWDADHPFYAAYVQITQDLEFSAVAATPAIAICIAALKARGPVSK